MSKLRERGKWKNRKGFIYEWQNKQLITPTTNLSFWVKRVYFLFPRGQLNGISNSQAREDMWWNYI